MSKSRFELPLAFAGHTASLYVTTDISPGWEVTTCIDGRVIGREHCHNWRSVERYRDRMQGWLKTAETSEGQRSSAA